MSELIPLPHIRQERKRVIEKYTPDTKSRVDRNFNESPLVRLYMNGRITQDQYGAAIRYLETYYAAYPTQSHEYKARVDGGGSPVIEYSLSAEDRVLRCGKLMEPDNYKALQMLVIDEAEPYYLMERFKWGKNSITANICRVLDELIYIWGETSRPNTT